MRKTRTMLKINHYRHHLILVLTAIHLFLYSDAKLKLPRLIGNGMVLQRDQPIPIWGWADKGEKIIVQFRDKLYKTVAGNDNKWMIRTVAYPAGGPYSMIINTPDDTIQLKDILLGDVWLCSGQSNMEFTMLKTKNKYAAAIAASDNPYIRQFFVRHNWSFDPVQDVDTGTWQQANPETVPEFTAVGYFFAKDLYDRYKIPVGIINSSHGGTPVEAWISNGKLLPFPAYKAKADSLRDSLEVVAIQQRDKIKLEGWNGESTVSDKGNTGNWKRNEFDFSSWKDMNVPGYWEQQGLTGMDGIVWFKKEIFIPASYAGKEAILILGTIEEQDTTYFNGYKIGSSGSKYTERKYNVPGQMIHAGRNIITVRVLDRDGAGGFVPAKEYALKIGDTVFSLEGNWRYAIGARMPALPPSAMTRFPLLPTAMYNSMIAPLIPFAIKGCLWYQGESNVSKANEYKQLLPALINDWRQRWSQKRFPFLIVQLPNFGKAQDTPSEGGWPELREAQSAALGLPDVYMSVNYDLGEWNDVHPLNKKEVAYRLALLARKMVYKEKSLIANSPSMKSIEIKSKEVVVNFIHTGSGLMAKGGGEVRGFSLAGKDRKFYWARATISGDKVVVWCDKVPEPVAVRYGWANNPEESNLFNKEGLPAAPFRSDNWQRPINPITH